jgi:hypothetical protein
MEAPKLDPPTEDPDDEPALVASTVRHWRTKGGTVLGIVGQLTDGSWLAMTPDEEVTTHALREDASLHLTLVYMRGPR